MAVLELLREIKGRGVELMAAPVEPRLRFRPASRLTPELVEGLRQHKAEILERLEGGNPATVAGLEVSSRHGDGLIRSSGDVHEPLLNSPVIQDAAEVLELARARLGEMAPEHKMDAPYPPAPPGRDPLAHKHTDKALYFAGARRRELERRERDGLPPWIRLVDGEGKA